ncbi:MAG: tellurite resistance TerB family protein [Candidatus Heimdallarchaeota archaeon]|nr:tellurite resistance TerB family protein [Candidatus Heimdallarchaeota archaeon]
MGIFDKLFQVDNNKSQSLTFTKEQGFMGILLAATEADGHIAATELETIRTTLGRSNMFHHLTAPQFQNMMNQILMILRRDGIGTVINAGARVLNQELKECVFSIAVDLVLSDGVLASKEKEFLENLQRALGISDELTTKIAEVMLIRNRA